MVETAEERRVRLMYSRQKTISFDPSPLTGYIVKPAEQGQREEAYASLTKKIDLIEMERSRLLFHIGCFACFGFHLPSLQPYATKLPLYTTIARLYAYCEWDFLIALKRSTSFNMEDFYYTALTTDAAPEASSPTNSVVKKLKEAWRQAKGDENTEAIFWDEIKTIRDYILAIIPVTDTLVDKNYLAFSPCSSCGVEAAPGGHQLVAINYRDAHGIVVPKCNRCFDKDAEVNYLYTTYLYRHYAHALEHTVNVVQGFI
jgi:hypothetical protein